jgi:hypothetical protein
LEHKKNPEKAHKIHNHCTSREQKAAAEQELGTEKPSLLRNLNTTKTEKTTPKRSPEQDCRCHDSRRSSLNNIQTAALTAKQWQTNHRNKACLEH